MQKIWSIIKKFVLSANVFASTLNDEIHSVRERFLRNLLYITVIAAFPALFIATSESLAIGDNISPIFYLGLFIVVLYTTIFQNRIPFAWKTLIFLGAFFALGIHNLIHFGFSGAGIHIFLIVSVLITILLGQSVGILTLIAGMSSILGVGVAMSTGVVSLDLDLNSLTGQMVSWITAAGVFLLLASVGVLIPGKLQNELVRSLEKLKKQSDMLSSSNKELEKEISMRKQAEVALRRSENYYRGIFETSGSAMFIIEEDTTISHVNLNFEKLTGYYKQEVEGKKSWTEFIHPDDVGWMKEYHYLRRRDTRAAPLNYEFRFFVRNGELRHAYLTSDMVPDTRQSVVSLIDITERKRAEKALQESEERFQKMLAMIPDMISIQDTDMNIIYSNWNGVGAVSEEKRVLNTKCYRTYRGYDNICPDCQARTVMETGKPFQDENKLSDGRWVSLRAFPILGKNGAVELFAEWVRDITDQKHVEEELRKSEKEHRRLFETMDQGVVYQDTKGKIISANPAAERILGLSFDQMKGKISINPRWRMIKEDGCEVPGTDHPAIIALRTGETVGPVVRGVFHPERSTYIWLSITVVPLFQQGATKPFQVYATFEDVTEHKQAVEELKEREAFIKATLDNLPVGVAVNSVDPEVRFTYMNDNFATFYRTTREALDAPNDFWEVVYKDPIFREQIKRRVLEDCASNDPERMYWEDIPVSRPGRKPFYITAKNIPLPENNLMVSTVWDVTNRKRAEEEREKLQKQLAQAQKMESVGRLAGGVAHDFNNKLSIINGYAELAMEAIDSSGPLQETIQEIHTAGKQSADIVRQLLAFARKQTISPVLLDLNDTISGMLKMLQRLIGENIDLAWHPGKNLWPVKIDPSQVDQIMANLAVNSRDAISDVGKLTIETDNIVVDEDYCRNNLEAIPGQYVMLAVSDDGCGIEEESKEQLFDPYFTTKEVGKGTGLGLPTIYGIVKQNKGFINVYSEPGEGTTFKLYFPSREETKLSLYSAKEPTGQIPTGTETVLVVEDEKTILQMSKRMLERLGYTVETAGSPAEALQISDEYDGTIHLLVTDVVMPEMNGRELSSKLLKRHLPLKTLYMSGYTADVIAHHGVLDEGVQFIQKPFSLRDLAAKVREVINLE